MKPTEYFPLTKPRTVRPWLVIFEFDVAEYADVPPSPWWKPGFFKGQFNGATFYRVWFWVFSVSFIRSTLGNYNRHIASGATEWRNS